MSERKELGRITRAEFGYGGYDEAMFGLTVTLGGEAWGVQDFQGWWASRPSSAEWSAEDQTRRYGEAGVFLLAALKAAKKKHVAELVGVPVEVTFAGMRMSSWRVLTEVI